MISDYYDQDITIQRPTAGTTWGSSTTWSDVGNKTKAAVNLTRGTERYNADKKTVFADYKLFMTIID